MGADARDCKRHTTKTIGEGLINETITQRMGLCSRSFRLTEPTRKIDYV